MTLTSPAKHLQQSTVSGKNKSVAILLLAPHLLTFGFDDRDVGCSSKFITPNFELQKCSLNKFNLFDPIPSHSDFNIMRDSLTKHSTNFAQILFNTSALYASVQKAVLANFCVQVVFQLPAAVR